MSGLCHCMLRSTAWGWWGRGISAYSMLLWVSVQLLLSWRGKHKQLPKVCKLCMTGQKLEPGFELGTSAFKRYWIIRTAAEWPFLFVFQTHLNLPTSFNNFLFARWLKRFFSWHLLQGFLWFGLGEAEKTLPLGRPTPLNPPRFLIAIPRTGSYKDCQWIICRGNGVISRKISWFDWKASLGQSCIHLAWIHPIRFWWFMFDWVCSWQGGGSLIMWRGLQTKRSGSNLMSPAILQPTMEGRIRRRSIHRRSQVNRYRFSCKKSYFVWRLSSAPGWLAFWLVQPLCFL